MSVRVTVSLEAGRLIAVKTAATPEEVARLRDEVARLRRVRHPGVVTLVGSGPTARGVEMRTVYAGEPLERWRGPLPRAAGVGAAVAATLADLHDMGVVHGRLDGSHVLIGPDGHPRLCGLSDPGGATPADDVRDLGELVTLLIERSADRRRGHRRWPARARAEQRALHHVARRALDPMPSRRPPGRGLARAILTAVPGAELPPAPDSNAVPGEAGGAATPAPPHDTLPGDPVLAQRPAAGLTRPRPPHRPGGTRGRRPRSAGATAPATGGADAGTARRAAIGVGAAGILALALVVSGIVAVRGPAPAVDRGSRDATIDPTAGVGVGGSRSDASGAGGGSQTGSIRGGRDGTSESGRGAAPSGPSLGTDAAAAGCSEVVAPSADVDGDGCREALRVDGRTIAAGAARWRLGEPGDVVAVGRWDCDPSAFPALLRPASGDVFVFWGWAAAGRPLTAEPVRRVAGATGIRAEPAANGCDRLVVTRECHAHVVVEVHRP